MGSFLPFFSLKWTVIDFVASESLVESDILAASDILVGEIVRGSVLCDDFDDACACGRVRVGLLLSTGERRLATSDLV